VHLYAAIDLSKIQIGDHSRFKDTLFSYEAVLIKRGQFKWIKYLKIYIIY